MTIQSITIDTEQWAVVPRVPTQEMVNAAKYGVHAGLSVFKWADGYYAMLAAAPRPEAGQQKYQRPVCRGSWALGSACGKCERCEETRPQQPAPRPVPTCETCNGNGMIGGPSYYQPDEGGVPCPDCAAPRPVPVAIPTSERLPTEVDADWMGFVYAFASDGSGWGLWEWIHVADDPDYLTHWQSTGLTRPADPAEPERHCMNCAEYGECTPSNLWGCGYESE